MVRKTARRDGDLVSTTTPRRACPTDSRRSRPETQPLFGGAAPPEQPRKKADPLNNPYHTLKPAIRHPTQSASAAYRTNVTFTVFANPDASIRQKYTPDATCSPPLLVPSHVIVFRP
jgi:hypothetical protein